MISLIPRRSTAGSREGVMPHRIELSLACMLRDEHGARILRVPLLFMGNGAAFRRT